MQNKENNTDWTALYLPALPEGEERPTRSGFSTKDEAWKYVYDSICGECKEEREKALKGLLSENYYHDDNGDKVFIEYSIDPPCVFEWMVIPTSDWENAESFDDLAASAGWTKIWEKDEGSL